MITKEQTEFLKELIGPRCLVRISQYFFQHMIVNREGDPYSQIYISCVLNGRCTNPTIENGIWDFAEQLKKEKERHEKRKAEILKAKEPKEMDIKYMVYISDEYFINKYAKWDGFSPNTKRSIRKKLADSIDSFLTGKEKASSDFKDKNGNWIHGIEVQELQELNTKDK